MTIAILSAMEEECISLLEHMEVTEERTIAGRVFYKGILWGTEVIIVFSMWGKVAASSTTVVLIREFGISEIIFTGVAGAIDSNLNIGDIVVGKNIYQHDLDVRPILARYEIPLLGVVKIEGDVTRQSQIYDAATTYVNTQLSQTLIKHSLLNFEVSNPKVVLAGIATGDQFITCAKRAAEIKNILPDVVCVEMEGGAVAQICNEFDIKFSIIRTISDSANVKSSINFEQFVNTVAKEYSLGIIRNLFVTMQES